jgi:1,2-diacylglycerol 3-beta-galactosyltransferase
VPGAPAAASVLILFSDTGGGHRAAARALDRALRLIEPSTRVAIADPLIGQGPRLVKRVAALYSPLIRRSRTAWGAVYHGGNTRVTFAALRAAFGPVVRKVIEDLIAENDPDVVVSVHPLLNQVAWQAIGVSSRPRPLMVVVTDLVEFHRGWAFRNADLITVPTEAARRLCIRYRVPAGRLRLLGLPIDLGFRPAAPGEKEALRRRFGLAEKRFTVLVSGGGAGSGRLLPQIRALAWRENPWQLIAVCGANEVLYRRLQRLRFATPTKVLGYVEDMPEVMRAADIVVSKAGPGAIGEALSTGIPIVLTGYLPGQETENVPFVTEHGIGLYAPQPDELFEAVASLAADGGRAGAEMSERTLTLARPYASLDIARECLALTRSYSAAAQAIR